MDGTLAGELTVLATALLRLAREDRRTRDFTLNSLRQALAEVVASFPVYRTYIVDKPSAQDRKFIDWAIGRARRRSLAADASVFDFLRRVLLGRPLPGAPAGLGERYRAFARRLQQYTAPVAAKGIEDTALYRHHRLISVNDVGGEPDAFGISVAAFHAASRDRAQHWPHTMLATSTHDAKRSEDVRARIDVISEMPAAWRLTVRRWSRMNRSHKRTVDGARAPTRNDEYLLYQTLIGSLPAGALDDAALAAYAERIDAGDAEVGARVEGRDELDESERRPTKPRCRPSCRRCSRARDSNLFLHDLQATAAGVRLVRRAQRPDAGARQDACRRACPTSTRAMKRSSCRWSIPTTAGRWTSTSARAAARAARRPAPRSPTAARAPCCATGWPHAVDGRAKFWVTWRALQLRREHEAAAATVPSTCRWRCAAQRAAHVLAFARRDGAQWIVVVAGAPVRSLRAGGRRRRRSARSGATPCSTAVWPERASAAVAAGTALARRGHQRPAPRARRSARCRWPGLLREFPVAALYGDAHGAMIERACSQTTPRQQRS